MLFFTTYWGEAKAFFSEFTNYSLIKFSLDVYANYTTTSSEFLPFPSTIAFYPPINGSWGVFASFYTTFVDSLVIVNSLFYLLSWDNIVFRSLNFGDLFFFVESFLLKLSAYLYYQSALNILGYLPNNIFNKLSINAVPVSLSSSSSF